VDEHEDTGATLTLAERDRIARHLAGDGIEVGPGSNPFPIPPGATVRYVDRWTPD